MNSGAGRDENLLGMSEGCNLVQTDKPTYVKRVLTDAEVRRRNGGGMAEPLNGPGPVFATDILGGAVEKRLGTGALSSRFMLPPFSVLDARRGEWQARKKAWIGLGIASELGRGGNVLIEGETEEDARTRIKAAAPGGGGGPRSEISAAGATPREGSIQTRTHKHEPSLKGGLAYGCTKTPYAAEPKRKQRINAPGAGGGIDGLREDGLVHRATCGAYTNAGEPASAADCGTSIFDPVLCELLYRWFSPVGGMILDPFAGGSVRGIVAGMLGRRYWGCDLSANQIAANVEQGEQILGDNRGTVEWVNGDSSAELEYAPVADMVMSCPPYHSLENYSKDPRDLSNMTWPDFRNGYWDIISQACGRLRNNRFAAFVVGDVRGPDGTYRNLPGDTIRAFERAGLRLYNELILVTAVGSLSIRTERQFFLSGKTGRTHQTALVFVKGDPVLAMDAVSGMTADERRAELVKRAEARAAAAAADWDGDEPQYEENGQTPSLKGGLTYGLTTGVRAGRKPIPATKTKRSGSNAAAPGGAARPDCNQRRGAR